MVKSRDLRCERLCFRPHNGGRVIFIEKIKLILFIPLTFPHKLVLIEPNFKLLIKLLIKLPNFIKVQVLEVEQIQSVDDLGTYSTNSISSIVDLSQVKLF